MLALALIAITVVLVVTLYPRTYTSPYTTTTNRDKTYKNQNGIAYPYQKSHDTVSSELDILREKYISIYASKSVQSTEICENTVTMVDTIQPVEKNTSLSVPEVSEHTEQPVSEYTEQPVSEHMVQPVSCKPEPSEREQLKEEEIRKILAAADKTEELSRRHLILQPVEDHAEEYSSDPSEVPDDIYPEELLNEIYDNPQVEEITICNEEVTGEPWFTKDPFAGYDYPEYVPPKVIVDEFQLPPDFLVLSPKEKSSPE